MHQQSIIYEGLSMIHCWWTSLAKQTQIGRIGHISQISYHCFYDREEHKQSIFGLFADKISQVGEHVVCSANNEEVRRMGQSQS